MILCVTGSRHWTDYNLIWTTLRGDFAAGYTALIHGDARGADAMAAHAAERLGFTVKAFPVDVRIDGPWPAAGPRRTLRMLATGLPDALRVFRASGASHGTDYCVRQANKMRIKIL
jgi:hypothetical protein